MIRTLQVRATGPLSTVQDLGRPGLASMGVGASGAADRGSLRLANRLVGNAEGAGAIEATMGGLALLARSDLTVAVTGALCPVSIGERAAPVNTLLWVSAGMRIDVGTPTAGLRNYVAVRGGIAVEPVLNSRSTDVLADVGPDRLRAGMELAVGTPSAELPNVDFAPVAAPPEGDVSLTVVPGPRDDWFAPDALSTLVSEPYEVTTDSDRVGMRLSGPVLQRCVRRELPSEGMVPGALQVAASGQPTLFLADHPVTGGYPVIAVVRAADVDRGAQLRAGQRVRFRRGSGR